MRSSFSSPIRPEEHRSLLTVLLCVSMYQNAMSSRHVIDCALRLLGAAQNIASQISATESLRLDSPPGRRLPSSKHFGCRGMLPDPAATRPTLVPYAHVPTTLTPQRSGSGGGIRGVSAIIVDCGLTQCGQVASIRHVLKHGICSYGP